MSTRHSDVPRARNPSGDAGRRKPRACAHSAGTPAVDLFELEELIRMASAAPARDIAPQVLAVLQTAARRTPEFSLRLALTALRLEQGLREAQERIIHLQWKLAQCRKYRAQPLVPAAEAKD